MNIDQLIVFKEIAERGTLRAAAAAIKRTQPAVSASLKQLEAHLGFQLFNRDTYRPNLTAQGKTMLSATLDVLSSVDKWQEIADDLKGGSEPSLTISIDSAVPLEIIIPRIQSITDAQSALRLELKFGVVTQGLDDLLNGVAQLAVAPMLVPHENIEHEPILKRKLIPVLHRRLTTKEFEVSAAALRKIPNIVVGSGNPKSQIGVPGLRGGKKIHVSNHAVKEQMIALGLGWGRVPEDTLTHNPDLVPISLHELPKVDVEISVAWKKDAPLGPTARKVRESLCGLKC